MKATKRGHGGRSKSRWRVVTPVVCFVVGVAVGAYVLRRSPRPEPGGASEVEAGGRTADTPTSRVSGMIGNQDEQATERVGSPTDSAPSVSDGDGSGSARGAGSSLAAPLAWLSPLCLGLIAVLYFMQRKTRREVEAVRADLSMLQRSQRPRDPGETVYPWQHDLAQLRRDMNQIEDDIQAFRTTLNPAASASHVSTPSQGETRHIEATQGKPAPAPHSDVRVMSGVISADDLIRLTSASRPMLEIRWREGDAGAEVWVNPEFKFADLTADLLDTAFEVDGGGPGAYETVTPALLEWSAGASAGRVRRRGLVRALRN